MVCKICQKDKPRTFSITEKGRYVYRATLDARQWHGRVCPDCIFKEAKIRRGTNRILEKECDICGVGFKTNRKDKVTCSTVCSAKRRSKVEVARQKRLNASKNE